MCSSPSKITCLSLEEETMWRDPEKEKEEARLARALAQHGSKRVRHPWFRWDPAAKSAPFVFPQMSKSDNFGEKMKEFMQKYDKNSDGKIEMAEVSPIVLAKSYME